MNSRAVIAALNDDQKTNDRDVANFLKVAHKKRDLDEVEFGTFTDFLTANQLKDGPVAKNASTLLNVLKSANMDFYEDYLKEIENRGIRFITIFDEEYPALLREISDPPLGLYVKGDVETLSKCVAIVGTRKAKENRIEFARQIANELVDLGYTVASGLATGIDTAAHEGALDAGGDTVAILPGEVEEIYPSSNTSLAKRIPNNGALVSEVSPEVDIHRGRFVDRNRITSGISEAVVIGASGETGGTVHQAKFATNQERRVLLYNPPNLRDGQSPAKLTRMGAIQFSTLKELREKIQADEEDLDKEKYEEFTLEDF